MNEVSARNVCEKEHCPQNSEEDINVDDNQIKTKSCIFIFSTNICNVSNKGGC
jgi:hypothetical protein